MKRQTKLLLITALMLMLLLGAAASASACYGCASLNLSCADGVISAAWLSGYGSDNYLEKVSGPSGPATQVLSGSDGVVTTPWSNGDYTIALKHDTNVYDQASISCFGPAVAPTGFFDGRINNHDGDKVAIYPIHDDDGVGVQVWLLDHLTVPTFSFYVTAAELKALPDADTLETPYLIAESDDGAIQMWLLPSGEYQVNYGPDFEGKVFVWRFDSELSVGSYSVETFFAR